MGACRVPALRAEQTGAEMKLKNVLLGAVAAAAATTAGAAHAQLPPPGYILDVGSLNSYGTTPAAYTQYSVDFIATLNQTTVSFAFREVPAFFSFDDASVALTGGGPNLLADPGFESATNNSNFPDGWTRFIQPIDQTAIGIVQTGTPNGLADNPNSGLSYWADGSVEGYDGLAQTVATNIGSTYTISFFLADDFIDHDINNNPFQGSFNNPNIDAFVYAGGGLPVNTVVASGAPEPTAWALMIGGFGLAGAALRRRRAAAAV